MRGIHPNLQPSANLTPGGNLTGATLPAVAPHLWNSIVGLWQPVIDSSAIGDTNIGIHIPPAALMAYNGSAFLRLRTPNVFKTVSLAAGTAETTIWTPAGGKKARVMKLWLTASAQTVLTFKDNTAGTTILIVELAANSPFHLDLLNGILSAAANNVITVTRGTSAALNGGIAGTEE